MEIKEFESLKKKQDELQLLKAKEETRLESLEKELENYVTQLKELGIDDLDNAEVLLDNKEKELQEQYNKISSLLSQFES
jgi:hypothetical protein